MPPIIFLSTISQTLPNYKPSQTSPYKSTSYQILSITHSFLTMFLSSYLPPNAISTSSS